MKMKHVLITGVAGFIGYSLAKRLAEEGSYEITGIDSINNYYDVQLKFDRLAQLGFSKSEIQHGKLIPSSYFSQLKFIQSDLENLSKMQLLFSTNKFDIVINLAAQAGVRHSLNNPHAYVNSNVTGFLNVLECCKDNQVKHLVYASSSSVYGLDSIVPFSEKEPANHPVSIYAATKKMNELMAYTYKHLYNLPVTGLRFFTVYGPWGRPDMSPMLFAKAICEGNPIKVFNYGNMRRDFTYIGDVIDGITHIIKKDPPTNYTLYNIGNSKPVELIDFIELMERKIGIKAIKDFLPMQAGDVYETYADTSLLFRDTGYKPTTSLEKGVGSFLDWYLHYYQIKI
jgi:UDP-glucuronate 4-epimerase